MKNLKDRACYIADLGFYHTLKPLKLLKTAGLSTVCSNTGIYLLRALLSKISISNPGGGENNPYKAIFNRPITS